MAKGMLRSPGERKQKTGHYRQEGIIIELSESGEVAVRVSIDSEGLTVLFLLITHGGSYVFGRFL